MCIIRRLYFMLLIILISTLISCSKTTNLEDIEEGNIPSQTTTEFTHNGQTFYIIPLFEEVLNYTSTAKGDASLNTKALYYEGVLKPFQEKLDNMNKDAGTYYFDYFFPTKEVEKLEKNTVELLGNQQLINESIKASLIKSTEHLSGSDKVIFLLPSNPELTVVPEKMEGISGVTFSEEVILLQIHPSFTENALKYTAAHEYHHAINMEMNGMKMEPLIGMTLNEGKADSFARIVYPDYRAKWTEPLSQGSEETVLAELQKNLDSYDPSIYYGFFGGKPSKGLPMWSNYRIGFSIVQSYLHAHPETSVEEWTMLEPEEILHGSEYTHILTE